MAEQFRGKTDSERTSSRDVSGAPHGADEPDVDAFLRQPRLSLTDEYWRPVDSLIPVRLTDMRDEEPSPPPRRRVRALDAVIAGVGLGAASLLVVLLLRKGDGHPQAHAVQSKTVVPRATATAPRLPIHAAVVGRPPAHPVPTATEATSPVPTATEATSPAQTTAPASNVQASIVAVSAPTSAATTAAAPSPSAASSPTETSSTEPKPAKRKRKHANRAPPTASFPDP